MLQKVAAVTGGYAVYSKNAPTAKSRRVDQRLSTLLPRSKHRSIRMWIMFCAAAALSCHAAHDVHAQEEGEIVIVRWMIEGQQQPPASSPDAGDGGSGEAAERDSVVVVIERLPEGPTEDVPDGADPGFKYDHFVTGNEYWTGDYRISIFSEEGQMLNQAIIDQREMQADSFRHKIKYYDRFSDGYVEIAEALLDPIGEQTYHIRGSTYDHPINTNLEMFLLERGYTLENLQAVPNSVFSPTEFTLGRALLEEAGRAAGGVGDLRAYSPNYMEFDRIDIGERMAESFSEQTAHILGQVLFAPEEAEPVPELYTLTPPPLQASQPGEEAVTGPRSQTGSSTLRDALDAVRRTAQPMFEDPGRVGGAAATIGNFETAPAEMVQRQLPQFLPTDISMQSLMRQYAVLLTVSVAAGLAASGYAVWRVRQWRIKAAARVQAAPMPMAPHHDDHIRKMLYDAQVLYDAGRHKEAHESLGQAIRLFYSHRLGTHGHLTNTELLALMRSAPEHDAARDYESVRRWLSVCGSVEYAKHGPDAKAFTDVLRMFSRAIGGPKGGAGNTQDFAANG